MSNLSYLRQAVQFLLYGSILFLICDQKDVSLVKNNISAFRCLLYLMLSGRYLRNKNHLSGKTQQKEGYEDKNLPLVFI